jgi:hypothetical protein
MQSFRGSAAPLPKTVPPTEKASKKSRNIELQAQNLSKSMLCRHHWAIAMTWQALPMQKLKRKCPSQSGRASTPILVVFLFGLAALAYKAARKIEMRSSLQRETVGA